MRSSVLKRRKRALLISATIILALVFCLPLAHASGVRLPGVSISLSGTHPHEVATAFKILLLLTVLSVAPAILIAMTAFTRIIIVLAILRHALGMQDTPPNTVLVSLAVFLTIFSMLPVFSKINTTAFKPYMEGKLGYQQAIKKGMKPLRNFMIRQTREKDLALMIKVSKSPQPKSMSDISTLLLVPAFMLSEMKTAFEIGFVIFLPFVLVDIVVASALMSMGMLMVPPMMISLPLKILMFVLIDGWSLVVNALLGSFH